MKQIQLATLKRALSMLDAIGAQYAIISADGTRFGTLQIAEEKSKPTRAYSYKELGDYIKERFNLPNVGDVLTIPVDKFKINELQSAISSHAVKVGGKGHYTNCRAKDKKSIEILRLK